MARDTSRRADNASSTEWANKHRRIGWGEFDWPDWRHSRSIGRTYFLHAVQDVEPRVLEDLADSLLPAYEAIGFARDDYWEYFDLRDYLAGHEVPDFQLTEAYVPLIEGLRAWGTRWWMTAPWCHTRAFETLRLWLAIPETQAKVWSLEGVKIDSPVDLTETEIELKDYGWNTVVKTWDEYEAEFMVFVRDALAKYRERMESLVIERGLLRTPEKRNPEEHYTWLARRQLHGITTKRISDDAGRSWKAVDMAITECAEFIALPLRPGARPGRPRK